jgi:4a-hydroxytetrahydrobiopterin dehydratase
MNLQETIKRILREGLDDKWTSDDNQTVTLKELLDIVKDIPITKMSTNKLIKRALHADNPDEQKNIEKANLKYPVLILVNDDESIKFIVDGHHRIQKAFKHKLPTVNAKLIKFSELPKKFREVLGGDKKNTWKEVNGKLVNKYKFSNYDETVNFVNKIEKIAKKQNHHPEITFGFDTVKLTITDHEKGGVSDKCHKFTKEVNKL